MEQYREEISRKDEETGKIEQGLFKGKMGEISKSNVVEAIAYNIAKYLGVPCCKALVYKYKNMIGSFSRYEVPSGYKMITLMDLFETSIMEIEQIYDIIKYSMNSEVDTFMKYMYFDYILGQQDRHLKNIAVINKIGDKGRNYKLYPLFDNGYALECDSFRTLEEPLNGTGYFKNCVGDIYDMYKFFKRKSEEDEKKPIAIIPKLRDISVSRDTIEEIIEISDSYKELREVRKKRIVEFILNRVNELLTI